MAVEDQQQPEEVAVDVLEDQREAGLAAVAAVGVGHRAGRGRPPEGPVVGLAVVVAGEAEAEREDQDEQRGRPAPEGQGPEGVAARHAALGDAGRVEGRNQVPVEGDPGVVVPADEGGPGRVDDERGEHRHRHHGLDPPGVLAQGGLVGPTPRASDGNRSRGCVVHRRRHSDLLRPGSAPRPPNHSRPHLRRRKPWRPCDHTATPTARQRHKEHEIQSVKL